MFKGSQEVGWSGRRVDGPWGPQPLRQRTVRTGAWPDLELVGTRYQGFCTGSGIDEERFLSFFGELFDPASCAARTPEEDLVNR